MNKKYKWSFVVGRFQIPHNEHFNLIEKAQLLAEKTIVFVGSAGQSRNAQNPFTFQERKTMLELALKNPNVIVHPIEDFWSNKLWQSELNKKIEEITQQSPSVVAVGHLKDKSSSYIKEYRHPTELIESSQSISSTMLRAMYFDSDVKHEQGLISVISKYTKPEVCSYLQAFKHTPEYQWLLREHKAVEQYKLDWPGIHNTGDALVKVKEKILIIQRGGDIGNGQLALPGGFLEPEEATIDCAIRELEEETQIAVLPSLLEVYLKEYKVFSHPKRSPRGRIITHAYYFDLGNTTPPEVHAQSDAKAVKWMSMEEIVEKKELFFEDHFHIVSSFLFNQKA